MGSSGRPRLGFLGPAPELTADGTRRRAAFESMFDGRCRLEQPLAVELGVHESTPGTWSMAHGPDRTNGLSGLHGGVATTLVDAAAAGVVAAARGRQPGRQSGSHPEPGPGGPAPTAGTARTVSASASALFGVSLSTQGSWMWCVPLPAGKPHTPCTRRTPNMRIRTLPVCLASVACLAALAGLRAPDARADPTWAPADRATIHPGVQTYTAGAQCTANFIFTNATDVFIGQAAHCSGTGAATETDGCDSASLPLGTEVEISGASRPGVLVYNSWLAMQEAGETDANTCAYNDFALVRIDQADHGKVNPSIPFWGGPVAVGDETAALERVYSYGNSSLRLGLTPLSPKTGVSLGSNGDGWNHLVYTVSPGIPGDSGSAFLDSAGNAIGVLSTLQIAPLVGSNGVGDVGLAIDYARSSGFAVDLVPGTEPFSPVL
ncbi:MAG TPA: S1C family serine protease [Acidimicrobiales bacterium]|nr:S1C family serine protease [Acidimicrobiales bacterium]